MELTGTNPVGLMLVVLIFIWCVVLIVKLLAGERF